MKTRNLQQANNLGKRAALIAVNGWRQFFHYAIRFKFGIAWNELMASKEQVKQLMKLTGDEK